MNIGDVIFQVIMLIFLLGIILSIYFLVRSIVRKGSHSSNLKNIEQKLDRITDLLEKERKE